MLVQALMQADLIDEINLMVHPAIAGSGKRLLDDGTAVTRLMKLVENRRLSRGVVALSYQLAR
jgi:riboflavin biosynthesis pyrimidine reductase